ncbi:hypothetical protein [Asaia bogorensis]|uniref:UrcA family protein n=1 Tax=Asaia bogorensis NBRC 16594 TaxID=1231624 RepID=A0AAN4R0P5_9PROT|nr:hypothetical protein [Asaia bogorensis]MDR6182360.1 membrane-bound lytic murein transglycosylase [Asaia bogorensis NBRC 16594]BAT19959.1 hypothetical protein Asbog_01695 [Asaia bogorensis NBRC 16594]GBQ80979.1 hypothetical protein AA0311_2492 [Asaia bogorensis NBRC 16594]GEL52623.1 hypothetical protein ABO01nite_06300 [Asaia bogorensis NBRC 16594]
MKPIALPSLLASIALASVAVTGSLPSVAKADPRAKCGQEPSAPSITATDTAHYNASVDKFQAYEKEARAYNSCVASASQKEEQAISEDARERIAKVHAVSTGVQQRIAANFSHISAELTAAGKKLAKK